MSPGNPTFDGSTADYRETLRSPWWAWLLPPAAAVFLGSAYAFALGAWPGLALALVTFAIGVALLLRSRIRVVVDRDALHVGQASLTWGYVGAVRALDPTDTIAVRRHRGHADAWLAVRSGYADESVVVEVADPRDPHPYWLISTRHPEALGSAIVRARDSHSES